VRLNGGTNIAAAVAKAGSLLKADEANQARDMRRVLVLLTGVVRGLGFRGCAHCCSALYCGVRLFCSKLLARCQEICSACSQPGTAVLCCAVLCAVWAHR
jgi:hypothetical protein